MVYTKDYGVLRERSSKLSLLLLAGLFALTASVAIFSRANAAETTTKFDFTQTELDTNWGPERIIPSGGYGSVSAYGRTNVAQIRVNSGAAYSNTGDEVTQNYYGTEGIKSPKGPADNFDAGKDFGQAVQVDLYLDQAWDNTAVRAGLWAVGDNGSTGTNAATDPFAIIEFANVDGYEGFRYFSNTGWVEVPGFKSYGKWVTLKVALDPVTDQYKLSINGNEVGTRTSPASSTYFRNVMLNQRNFGLLPQTTLNENSYNAHWNGGVVELNSKEQCKNDGYKAFGFRNQGLCIQFVNTGKDSRN